MIKLPGVGGLLLVGFTFALPKQLPMSKGTTMTMTTTATMMIYFGDRSFFLSGF